MQNEPKGRQMKPEAIFYQPTLDSLARSDEDIEAEGEGSDEDEAIVKPYDPRLIRVDPKTFSLRNILDMIDDGDLELAPDFQRLRVWTPKQKSRLIESVLLRIPLPAFYFSSDMKGNMQVVDGLQRLSTIHDFVRNSAFVLQHLEYLDSDLGGKSFSEIDGSVWSKRINSTQITVNVIDPQTPSRVKFDIFKRINTGGTPLNAQEIRHCMSGKRTRDLLKRLTALNSFDVTTGGKIPGHLRMADRELALRWVAFFLLDSLDDYGGDKFATLEDLLNSTTERVDSDQSIDVKELLTQFDQSMNAAYELFGRHAFRKWLPKDSYRYPLNKALFEAWSVPLARANLKTLAKRKGDIQGAFRDLCATDEFFISSISAGTGDSKKVRYRFLKIEELLAQALA
jgi:hypothetical protein